MTVATKEASSILPANRQSSVPLENLLHSTNCGLLVHRKAAVKAEFRSEGRIFARELAEYITANKLGIASVFVYEETFGTKDVLHWLLHISDLGAYDSMVKMGSSEAGFREIFFKQRVAPEKGGGTWDRLFLDGTISETVLLPWFSGIHGTTMENKDGRGSASAAPDAVVPPAARQTASKEAAALNSITAGIVLVRSAQVKSQFREEGRVFGHEVAALINERLPGRASAFLYEEAFGVADRIHWMIHMKDLSCYYDLINMHGAMDPKIVATYTRDRIAPEKGGGNWSRIFDGSFVDLALTPQHWNMYTTQTKQ